MKGFLNAVAWLSRFVNVVAGISLTLLMLLTVVDVILRGFKRPIVGTYELVAFLGAIAIGFSVPLTSWLRGHIFVDFIILKFPSRLRDTFNIITRGMVIFLFLMIGWNLIKYALDLHRSGEVSLTLRLPFYPIAYAIGICCFIQCLVIVCDVVKIVGGRYE
jgi:TRAP-type C4-dicarboxylate transport system permease small subunit